MKIAKVKTVSPPKGKKVSLKAKTVKPTKRASSMKKLDGGYAPTRKPDNNKKISKAKTVKPTKRGAFVGGSISKRK